MWRCSGMGWRYFARGLPRVTPHTPLPADTPRVLAARCTAPTPTMADAKTPIALLFCGQGAQTVGMTQKQLAIPEVTRMYDVASEVLGYDLKQIVLEGEGTLSRTKPNLSPTSCPNARMPAAALPMCGQFVFDGSCTLCHRVPVAPSHCRDVPASSFVSHEQATRAGCAYCWSSCSGELFISSAMACLVAATSPLK